MADVRVAAVAPKDLTAPLKLLEEYLRDGEPVPEAFTKQLSEAIEAGSIEILLASANETPCGVATISYHPNFSLGGAFASIEDLYVRPAARRRGVGRALQEAAEQRCSSFGISYLEAQVEDSEAAAFYAALGYEVEAGVRVFSRSVVLRPINEKS